jgi:hypothetical protein
MAKLEVALFAEAELLGRLQGPQVSAFPFKKHGKLQCNFITRKYGKRAAGPDKLLELEIEVSHGIAQQEEEG